MSKPRRVHSDKMLEAKHVHTLFHIILFAYQKKLREMLGPGAAVFLQPALDFVEEIIAEDNRKLDEIHEFLGFKDRSSDVEQALHKFASAIQTSSFAQRVSVTRKGDEFDLKVEGCKFNPECYVHRRLELKDAVCPWGLLGMLIFKNKTGLEVQPEETVYDDDEALTKIRAKEQ